MMLSFLQTKPRILVFLVKTYGWGKNDFPRLQEQNHGRLSFIISVGLNFKHTKFAGFRCALRLRRRSLFLDYLDLLTTYNGPQKV